MERFILWQSWLKRGLKGRGINYANVDHFKDGLHADLNLASLQKHSSFSQSQNAYYKDFDGKVYGPHTGDIIQYWLEKNYISERILVAVSDSTKNSSEFAAYTPDDSEFRAITSYF